MKIGIITAMSSEQKQLANQLENPTERKEGPFTYTEGTIKNNTIILMHSVGSIPHGAEIDVPLNYADYYFLEALMRKRDLEK